MWYLTFTLDMFGLVEEFVQIDKFLMLMGDLLKVLHILKKKATDSR